MHMQPNLTLPEYRSWSTHGHHTPYVELLSLIIHVKFQDHLVSGSREQELYMLLPYMGMADILVM